MSSTAVIKLSDAELRRQAAQDGIRTVRDPRHPGLRLRFWQSRQAGTWYLVRGDDWLQLARWPDVGVSVMLAELPEVRRRLLRNPVGQVRAGELATVGAVLDWYAERLERDRNLSAKRKGSARSAISRQLRPLLGELSVPMLTRSTVDRELIWPLQERYSVSYVRQILVLLLTVFRRAEKVGVISANPVAGLSFGDFSNAKIPPKAARLRGVQLPELVADLASAFDKSPADAMLALMMLCHGTRIGETRQAQWRDISLGEREWFIPADRTKTRTEHRLPLTAQVCDLLTRYKARQSAKGYEGVYLFPGKRGMCLSEAQGSRAFTRLGKGEWTSHDLRKVARSAWVDLGVDGFIGEMLLNHSLGKVASSYIHTRASGQLLLALETWHEHLDRIGFKAIHAEITPGSVNATEVLQPNNYAGSDAKMGSVSGEVSK